VTSDHACKGHATLGTQKTVTFPRFTGRSGARQRRSRRRSQTHGGQISHVYDTAGSKRLLFNPVVPFLGSAGLACPVLGKSYLFTGWRAFSEQVLKIPLDKFRDFGYVKLREFEHGVAEELRSSWAHRKIKAEDHLPSAAVAQYSPRELAIAQGKLA